MEVISKRRNLAEEIRDVLFRKITSGELRPGTPLASNKELAKEFKVSFLTADRAVRQLVETGLVYREQGRGTFVSKNLSKNNRNCRIGIADKMAYSSIPMQEAALDIRPRTSIQYLKNHHCETRILDYEEVRDPDTLKREAANLDALLVSSTYLDPVTTKNLLSLSIPIVISHQEQVLELPFHQVIPDYFPGMHQIAERIMRHEPPDIIVVYESHSNGKTRKDRFIDTLIEAGYERKRIRETALKEWAIQSGVASYKLAMKLCSEIRGKLLFSTSDIVSFIMIEAFREKNLIAGKDFQLVSSDNLEDYGYAPFESPQVTSIDIPKVKIAERAVKLLLEQIEHPAEENLIVRIPAPLVVRKTAFS